MFPRIVVDRKIKTTRKRRKVLATILKIHIILLFENRVGVDADAPP